MKPQDGWRNEGGWFWVHGACHKPTRAFLENFVQDERNIEGTTVNLFWYGDHHGELWTNDELLHGHPERGSCASWITAYAWTKRTVAGSESGRLGRVWVHVDALDEVGTK